MSLYTETVFNIGREIPEQYLLGLCQADPPIPTVNNSHQNGDAKIAVEGDLPTNVSQEQPIDLVSDNMVTYGNKNKQIYYVTICSMKQDLTDFWAMHERVRPYFVVSRQVRMPVWETSIAEDVSTSCSLILYH